MTGKNKTEDRIISEQLGAIVVILGIVDFAWTMYAAPKGQVKFDIALLLVGLPILFGGMRVISAMRWLACFCIVPALMGIVAPLITTPMSLIQVEARLAASQFFGSMVPGLVALGLVLIVALRLGSAPILAARAAAGRKLRHMCIPFALGALASVIMTGAMIETFDSEGARKAEQLAAARFGAKYRYHTIFIGLSSGTENYFQANVQAWNENELLLIPVRWEN